MSIELTERQDSKPVEVQVRGEPAHRDDKHLEPKFEQIIKEHSHICIWFEMAGNESLAIGEARRWMEAA